MLLGLSITFGRKDLSPPCLNAFYFTDDVLCFLNVFSCYITPKNLLNFDGCPILRDL